MKQFIVCVHISAGVIMSLGRFRASRCVVELALRTMHRNGHAGCFIVHLILMGGRRPGKPQEFIPNWGTAF